MELNLSPTVEVIPT